MRRIAPALSLLALLASSAAQASNWEIDSAHSNVGFSVRHLMVSNVKGHFSGVKGALTLDDADVTKSSVEATIESATVDTATPGRDKHLKSADFFDVEKYPTIAFKSKSVAKTEAGLKVVGDLTMHGVTKEVTLEGDPLSDQVKDPWGNTRMGVTLRTKLDRKEFGIVWSKTTDAGGLVVGNEVKVELELELVQKKEEGKEGAAAPAKTPPPAATPAAAAAGEGKN